MSKWKKFFAFLLIVGVGVFCIRVYTTIQNGNNLAEKRSSPQGQLPDTVAPLSYTLALRIDPSQSTFSGVVKIQVKIKKAINQIWFHGKGLVADKVMFNSQQGSLELAYKEMGETGVVRLTANQTIKPQIAELEIHYHASFSIQLSGLYKVEEKSIPYIFSQFESVSARQAFPCFDEPRFKVPFDLTLDIKVSDKGFANTPQIDEQLLADGFKRLTFATTKPLPTYLLAIIVGDFDVVEYTPIAANDIRNETIALRGISVKGKADQLHYALENTASILTILEAYFGTPYPYEKLDLVAVPDFSAGAMENAGLITYREQLLLLGATATFEQRRKFASTHAHELAHQWFGNLVTMPWWDDIWLNEAFATWMANRTMNVWDPKFEFSRDMVRKGHDVMSQDALISARRIREPIENNDVIDNAFDGITYQKGGAVLQMFERFIGAETFQKGVQYHMQRFAYGHANANDFIESIEHVSGKVGLKAAFFSFLTQPGVPVLQVDWQCENNRIEIKVKQSRYLPLGSAGDPKQLWNVPVCLSLIADPMASAQVKVEPVTVCDIVTQAEQVIEVQGGCPVAIMPNNQGSGYYRFSFNTEQWQQLLRYLPELSAAEKYAVANNLAAGFRAGDIDASFYLKAIKPFTVQDDWDLITVPMDELDFINNYVANDQEREQLAVYLEQLYLPLLGALGLTADTAADKANPVAVSLLRKKVVEFMALKVKEPKVRQMLLALAKSYIGFGGDQQLNPSVMEENVVQTALSVAVDELGQPYFKALKAIIDDSNDSTFRQRGLRALGSTTEPLLAEEVRSMALSLSIKNNERRDLISAQLGNRKNHHALYDWLKSYFGVVARVLPEHLLAYTPRLVSGLCTMADAQDVERFFTEKVGDVPGVKHNLEMALERIKICVALTAKQQGIRFDQ